MNHPRATDPAQPPTATALALRFVERVAKGQVPAAAGMLAPYARAAGADLLLRDAYHNLTTKHGRYRRAQVIMSVPLMAPEEIRRTGLERLAQLSQADPEFRQRAVLNATVPYDIVLISTRWLRGVVAFQVVVVEKLIAGSGHWALGGSS